MRDDEDTTEIPDGYEDSEQALDLELQRCDELLAGAEPLVRPKHDDAPFSAVGRFLRGRDPHHSADEPTFKDAEHRLEDAVISSRLHPWTSPKRVDDNLFDFLALVHELRWDEPRAPRTEVGLFMRLHLVLRIIDQTHGRGVYERVVQILGRVQDTRGFASCLKHIVDTCADEHSVMARLAVDRTTTEPIGSYDTRKKLVARRWARLCVLTLWAKVFAKSHGDPGDTIARSNIEWPAGMATTAIKGTAEYRESLKIQKLARLSLEEAGEEIESSYLESDFHDTEAIAIFAKTMSDVYSEIRLEYKSMSSFIRQTTRLVLPAGLLSIVENSAHAQPGSAPLESASAQVPQAYGWLSLTLAPLGVAAAILIAFQTECGQDGGGLGERERGVRGAAHIVDLGIDSGSTWSTSAPIRGAVSEVDSREHRRRVEDESEIVSVLRELDGREVTPLGWGPTYSGYQMTDFAGTLRFTGDRLAFSDINEPRSHRPMSDCSGVPVSDAVVVSCPRREAVWVGYSLDGGMLAFRSYHGGVRFRDLNVLSTDGDHELVQPAQLGQFFLDIESPAAAIRDACIEIQSPWFCALSVSSVSASTDGRYVLIESDVHELQEEDIFDVAELSIAGVSAQWPSDVVCNGRRCSVRLPQDVTREATVDVVMQGISGEVLFIQEGCSSWRGGRPQCITLSTSEMRARYGVQ